MKKHFLKQKLHVILVHNAKIQILANRILLNKIFQIKNIFSVIQTSNIPTKNANKHPTLTLHSIPKNKHLTLTLYSIPKNRHFTSTLHKTAEKKPHKHLVLTLHATSKKKPHKHLTLTLHATSKKKTT
jgi:hypothetical protein